MDNENMENSVFNEGKIELSRLLDERYYFPCIAGCP